MFCSEIRLRREWYVGFGVGEEMFYQGFFVCDFGVLYWCFYEVFFNGFLSELIIIVLISYFEYNGKVVFWKNVVRERSYEES